MNQCMNQWKVMDAREIKWKKKMKVKLKVRIFWCQDECASKESSFSGERLAWFTLLQLVKVIKIKPKHNLQTVQLETGKFNVATGKFDVATCNHIFQWCDCECQFTS